MKKLPDAPPELTDWQLDAFDRVARSKVAAGLVFAGGAALSAVHLHHRFSEDLDFFSRRELAAADLAPLAKSLRRSGVDADQRTLGPIRTLVLSRAGVDFGKLDFPQMGSLVFNFHKQGQGIVDLDDLLLIRKTEQEMLEAWDD